MGMVKEFKDFAMRGNVVDLAVGVVIGGAFGKIVTSLVNDVIMPIVGKLTGGVDFSSLAFTIQEATKGADGKEIPAVMIRYGAFINAVVDFLIVAFVIFLVVKGINTARRKIEGEPAAAAPPEDVKLLREIRDALVKKA